MELTDKLIYLKDNHNLFYWKVPNPSLESISLGNVFESHIIFEYDKQSDTYIMQRTIYSSDQTMRKSPYTFSSSMKEHQAIKELILVIKKKYEDETYRNRNINFVSSLIANTKSFINNNFDN